MYFVFGKEACPNCSIAVKMLTESQEIFEYLDVSDKESLEEMYQKLEIAGRGDMPVRTVPQIMFQEDSGEITYIGGMTDLRKLLIK